MNLLIFNGKLYKMQRKLYNDENTIKKFNNKIDGID